MHDQLFASSQQLLDLINLLYADSLTQGRDNASPHAHQQHLIEPFFERLRAFVAFESAALLPVDPVTFEIQPGRYLNCRAEIRDRYLDEWASVDPCLLSARCPTKLNETVSLTRLAEQPERSAEIASMRASLELEHAICVIAGWRERPFALLRLHRTAAQPDFSDAEIAFINGIAPHIATSIALSDPMLLQALSTESGLLALDREGRLVFDHGAAIDILASLQPESLLKLVYSEPIWRQRETGNYRIRRLPISPRSLLSWLTHQPNSAAADVSPDHPGSDETAPPAFTLIVLEPLQRRQAVASRLRHSRLSRREIEVALSVMRGLSNADIATELGIDEKTVKDHLRRIYGKIDVRSRTGMISKVLGLDAELPIAPTGRRKRGEA